MAPRTVPVSATRATNDKITGSGWNAGPVASNTFLTGKPECAALVAVTTIANNTLTAMPLTQRPPSDSDNGCNDPFHTTRYAVQVAGWYMVAGGCGFAINATGQRQMVVRKNGADVRAASSRMSAAASAMGLAGPALLLQLAVGDYVEVWAIQNAGPSLTTNSTTTTQGALTLVWISS